MAAAVYLKVTDAIGRTSVTLLYTKTEVAPLKPLTIPRLELNAPILLAKLTRYVKNTLILENVQTYLWTDSAVTLAWINSQAARWKTHVRNRVVTIQEYSNNASWNFIARKQNPADCASRGLSVAKLLEYSLWWSGPQWISTSSEDWPTFAIPCHNTVHTEERPGLSFALFASTDSDPLQTLLERCSTHSKLLRNILRVGGRLKNSLLDSQQKHPAILPKHSLLTSMLIDYSHKKAFHGGTQQTLADLRQSVWIIGGRVPVRSHILRCGVCSRHRGVRAQQLMGQLPPARVIPSRAFLHTRLDYAGPVTLKAFQGCGTKTYKAWIAVFVCFATSAIHIEIVTNYSSGAFIAAYKRFASRRGICDTIYSDCGTNFVGADALLKKDFAAGSKSLRELTSLLTKDGTKWKFNPPGAPHFGGKWKAAVVYQVSPVKNDR
ncbi:uncharacterized protein LOC130667196 [Microplitis mediator]|uniref:uncharacterized protein LOC130667196 n=1 Tax=Microplitis mediator TaxID=375433 RepID=UPI002557747B|nr:uncharacterized protein LOC130667196 [Microplitis mediator]